MRTIFIDNHYSRLVCWTNNWESVTLKTSEVLFNVIINVKSAHALTHYSRDEEMKDGSVVPNVASYLDLVVIWCFR